MSVLRMVNGGRDYRLIDVEEFACEVHCIVGWQPKAETLAVRSLATEASSKDVERHHSGVEGAAARSWEVLIRSS